MRHHGSASSLNRPHYFVQKTVIKPETCNPVSSNTLNSYLDKHKFHSAFSHIHSYILKCIATLFFTAIHFSVSVWKESEIWKTCHEVQRLVSRRGQ